MEKILKIEEKINDVRNLFRLKKENEAIKDIVINFISSKDNDEGRVMHSKINNKKIKINDNTDKVIEKLFKSLLNDIHWKKLCFTQFSARMAAWLLLTFFMYQLKSIHFIMTY